MLKPQIHRPSTCASQHLLPIKKPFLYGAAGKAFLPVLRKPRAQKAQATVPVPGRVKAAVSVPAQMSISVKAIVRAKQSVGGLISSLAIEKPLDDIKDLFGKALLLELVSAELDPETGLEKETIQSYGHRAGKMEKEVSYEADFVVPREFGEVGAILVENEHHREMFLEDIVLEGLPQGLLKINCSSWVHSKYDNPEKRVFFINKPYLPSQTPSGLRRLREEELRTLRGNGQGQRKAFERIYDYDVYNDLGQPDLGEHMKRPVLGGKDFSYPRRCRTGRPRCQNDPLSESRSKNKGGFYVPRDETFSEIKQMTFSARTFFLLMHALVPSIDSALAGSDPAFSCLSSIDSMFKEGLDITSASQVLLRGLMPRLFTAATEKDDLLRFQAPETMNRDRLFWFRDWEFARQTLAGVNPYSIRLVTEWPIESKLDPGAYGPPESAITAEAVEREIKGCMTFQEAIKKRKLFIVDHHDILLPYVKKVRELKGTTLYGSRTLFFLNPDETLRPLAIELTRPPMDGKPQWKRVFSPSWHSTGCWLWRVAKVHALAHDSGYHQLVSHWLRTHCVTEPYIIASNRQLSAMHPIYKLLKPHFRYTLEINALARESLINADGIIEASFSPGKYSMELSSAAYDKEWRFDLQALPADLINRGMAVEDSTAPHGLRLTIEDYPFANDGLLLWDAIKGWISDYVNHHYPDNDSIRSDEELQAWWTEIRTVGHADKKDEPWWPTLATPLDLIGILTIMVWVASGHHAAVNFGQYTFGGYFPNRPTIARAKMPCEDPSEEEWKTFLKKPESALLKCFPSRKQATKVMAVLDVLSNHSPDEEYLGEKMEPSWAEDAAIKGAFERLNSRLREIERIIDERNENVNLKNRSGAGIVPYELLKPFSEPGVTAKGVPYSISI